MSAILLAILALPTASAAEPLHASSACGKLKVRDLVADPGPGVVVVGIRHGTPRDVAKVRRLVKKLAVTGPVTVGLDAVEARRQEVLERLDLGRLPFERLQEALEWNTQFGFDYSTYTSLFALHELPTVSFLAMGQPVELRPSEAEYPVPRNYPALLAANSGDAPVPAELEERFAETVAWHDHSMAQAALEAWRGRGWLVLVVDRAWVEGGLGVPWQASRITDVPVQSALARKSGRYCYEGDRILR